MRRSQRLEGSPDSSNSQPNFRASWIAVANKAVWCISFFGIQPTFTQVPPRPDKGSRCLDFTMAASQVLISVINLKRYLTPRGSLRCWDHIVQHHNLFPQEGCFLLLVDPLLLSLCCKLSIHYKVKMLQFSFKTYGAS